MKPRFGLWVLKYLRFWGRLQLKKMAPDVIGITGSAGKTSCRNAVAAILQDKYQLKVSYKANSESGIPLNVLGIKPKNYSPTDWLRMCLLAPIKLLTNWQAYEKYVVEMGIDSPTPPKNMEYLLTIVQPRTAIYLNALPVHTAFFPPSPEASEGQATAVDRIAREKGRLIESLPENGLAILNADDKRVAPFALITKAKVMTFGKNGQVKITGWKVKLTATEFNFEYEKQKATLKLPYVLPEHFGYSLAAALSLGIDEDYTLEEGAKLLSQNYKLPPSRSSILAGINGSTIIDSAYNASPQTMKDMLELLDLVPGKRKLAILGDMRELGAESHLAHEKIVKQALKICGKVYLVGRKMHQTGAPGASVLNAKQAAAAIKAELRHGDVVLIKGSRDTILLEKAVEILLADPKDSTKLCRRGEYWERQRKLF